MNQRLVTALIFAASSLSVQAQSLSDAFNQGTALGRSGNAAARSQINGNTAQSNLPGYTTNPSQTSYFGGAGISTPGAAAANADLTWQASSTNELRASLRALDAAHEFLEYNAKTPNCYQLNSCLRPKIGRMKHIFVILHAQPDF